MKGLHICIAVLVTLAQAAYEEIYLEDGGYKNILLAINENVPYDPNIIPNLKVNWQIEFWNSWRKSWNISVQWHNVAMLLITITDFF